MSYKVGYFVGSLATGSINRVLSTSADQGRPG